MYYIDKKYYIWYIHYMTYYSTVTSKGQMTLPADIREKLHIKPGQRVAIRLNNQGEAVIEPAMGVQELRQKAYESLAKRGIGADQVREMALNYKNGYGFEAAVKEKYGKR